MQGRQKILFTAAIFLLAAIALIEGVVILRDNPRWQGWTASVSRAFRSPAAQKTEKEDIILQETAEDLEKMQNQINRLFYEMTRNSPFAPQNVGSRDSQDRQNPFAAMQSTASSLQTASQPEDNIRRLQSEIAHIFQMAHASRHNNALNLIEQDWRDVGEIASMNMEEDGTNYIVAISMPGFVQTNINVSLNGRILAVEAAAEQQREESGSRTARSGHFNTRIMLPNDIAGESAQAIYRDGILKITVPKKPASNSLARKVTIM